MSDEVSIEDALSKAWEEAEAAEAVTESGITGDQLEDEDAPSLEAEVAEDVPRETPAEQAAEQAPEQAEEPEVQDKVTSADDAGAPPRGLRASAREKWKDTPKEIRDEIIRREQDFAAGIEKHREKSARADQYDQFFVQHQQFFAMNGGPQNVLPGLLQTASLLQMGTQQQKARAAANIIKQFGVDIQELDGVLAGEPQSQPQSGQDDLRSLVRQELAPLQQFMSSQQDQQRQAIQSDIQQFANDPKNEFFQDVSGLMADILDLNARNGQSISLKEAYEMACNLTPDVKNTLDARRHQEETAARRNAASSVSGAPSSQPSPRTPDTLRGAIEQAMEQRGL